MGLTVDEIKQTKPKKVGDGSGFAQFNMIAVTEIKREGAEGREVKW